MSEPAWTDEHFVGEEMPLDLLASEEHMVEREMQIDKCLSRYRAMVELLVPVWDDKVEFERWVARRTIQIYTAGCYPDPLAPDVAKGGQKREKITRTDAAALAEAETVAVWPRPDPRVTIERIRQHIHELQYRLKGRDTQTSAIQTLVREASRAVNGAR